MSTFNKYRLKGAFHHEWYETEDWYKYLVDRAVKFCKGSTVDVGGGDGVVARLIRDEGYETIVLDNDVEAERLCKELEIGFRKTDLDVYPWCSEDIKYDYMTCINAIEHFNKPENVLRFFDEHIAKGAIITTIDYQGGSLGEDHKFEWTMEEMIKYFSKYAKVKPFRYKDTYWIGIELRK